MKIVIYYDDGSALTVDGNLSADIPDLIETTFSKRKLLAWDAGDQKIMIDFSKVRAVKIYEAE